MEWHYPTKYSDARGTEHTTLHNDGSKLTMQLRGVTFSDQAFDGLEPDPQTPPELLSRFDLDEGRYLRNCTIVCEIPVPVMVNGREVPGTLDTQVELGPMLPRKVGWSYSEIAYYRLSVSIRFEGQEFRFAYYHGDFEHALNGLGKILPAGTYLKACINCAFSDYSPIGNGDFGCMLCFREHKKAYSQVKSKHDFLGLWRSGIQVQETYLCPEFEKRKPETGYRG